LIPISISVVILYIITKDKKSSIIWSIIGLPCAFLLDYLVPVSEGQGIIWVIMNTNIIAQSDFAPLLWRYYKILIAMSLDAAHDAVGGVIALAKQENAGRCNERRSNGSNKNNLLYLQNRRCISSFNCPKRCF
jgi:hypothetical protein